MASWQVKPNKLGEINLISVKNSNLGLHCTRRKAFFQPWVAEIAIYGVFFFPCVLYRNRSRQEEVQKCLLGVSARGTVKHFTLSADWLTRNQSVKGTEEPFTLKSFSPILGRRMEGKGKFMGEKWGFSYFAESRLVTKQILFHSGTSSAPCWRCEALPVLCFLFQRGMDREVLIGVFGSSDNWNIRILPNILLFI